MGERSQDILARRSEGGGIMKIPISKLLNNTGQIEGVPTNPRTIDKADYQKLLKSIQEDPEYLDHEKPHVIAHGDKYVVLNGNQRLRALKELGCKETECEVYKPDTPAKVLRARIIKSNHGYGKDDMEMLGNEWSDEPLTDWGVDLPEDWLEQEPEIEEDEAPEVSDEPPVSKLGEVYQLGRHRVMCGDSTDFVTVSDLMDGTIADMVLTDPPYGVDYEGINNDSRSGLSSLLQDSFANYAAVTQKGGAFYCFHSDKCADIFHEEYRKVAKFSSMLIWVKPSLVLSQSDYHSRHEPCFYGWFEGASHSWNSDRKQTTVYEIGKESVDGHTTPKPIELLSKLIQNSSKKAAVVLDLFLGSGSTLIACEQTDRTCYGMELDPKYVDVIRKRYHKFVTGNEEGWEEATPRIGV